MNIRESINIVEGAYKKPFILHPSLNPENYVMTNSLRDYQSWKAINYAGYSQREAAKYEKENIKKGTNYEYPVKGEMGEVGYVMISLVDNTIIPISRADEHHQGNDVLWDLSKTCKFNPTNYIPVWAAGTNYIYRKEDIKDWLIVIPKFLSYGGVDGVMTGSSAMTGTHLRLSDFVKCKGIVVLNSGELAPLGKEFIAHYEKVAGLIRAASDDQFSKSKINAAFSAALTLNQFLLVLCLLLPWRELEEENTQIKKLKSEQNVSGLEQLLFGHNSIKNQIHIKMKQCIESNKDYKGWEFENLEKIFGDVPLAINLFSRF